MFMYIMYGIPKDKRESAMMIYKTKKEVLIGGFGDIAEMTVGSVFGIMCLFFLPVYVQVTWHIRS